MSTEEVGLVFVSGFGFVCFFILRIKLSVFVKLLVDLIHLLLFIPYKKKSDNVTVKTYCTWSNYSKVGYYNHGNSGEGSKIWMSQSHSASSTVTLFQMCHNITWMYIGWSLLHNAMLCKALKSADVAGYQDNSGS